MKHQALFDRILGLASEAGAEGLPRDAFGNDPHIQQVLAEMAAQGQITLTADRITFRPAPPSAQDMR